MNDITVFTNTTELTVGKKVRCTAIKRQSVIKGAYKKQDKQQNK